MFWSSSFPPCERLSGNYVFCPSPFERGPCFPQGGQSYTLSWGFAKRGCATCFNHLPWRQRCRTTGDIHKGVSPKKRYHNNVVAFHSGFHLNSNYGRGPLGNLLDLVGKGFVCQARPCLVICLGSFSCFGCRPNMSGTF